MGLSYTIDFEHGVVRTRGWGVITSQEIRDDTSRKLIAEAWIDEEG